MSLSFICPRCAQRLRIGMGRRQLFRNYVSTRERDGDDTLLPGKGPEFRLSNGQGVSIEKPKRAWVDRRHQEQEAQKRGHDKVLESLFSSNLISSEQPTESRYSRVSAPLASTIQRDRTNYIHTTINDNSRSTAAPTQAGTPPSHQSTPSPASTPRNTPPSVSPQPLSQSSVTFDKIHWEDRHDALRDMLRSDHVDLDQVEGNILKSKLFKGTNEAALEAGWLSALKVGMGKAVKRSNAELAVQVWTQAQQDLDNKDLDGDFAKVDALYTQFLSGFFQLRRAETATAVWNYMVQKGHQINKMHWTAMLHGCIRAHDASSLQDVWANMRKSNITPDTAAWTTYICGLIKCRHWREGIVALDQLGRVWKSRQDIKPSHRVGPASPESDSKEDQPIPSLAPVNAALGALVDLGKPDLLDTVLNWASSHGLHPDTHTFNILLRPLARGGDLAAIQSHLATMSANKCEPDIVTFTVILSSMVSSPNSNFHHLAPSDQESTILSLLNTMRVANVAPNTYTYSALLSALLLQPRSPDHKNSHPSQSLTSPPITPEINISAAHTVLAHMAHHSIPPTPHIATILLSHYFAQSPPDLPAVRSLWLTLQSSSSSPTTTLTDPILYDRMISGLADAGQARDSLAFVRAMVNEGKVPSWVALGRCLEGLYRVGDWDGVRWLVEGVEGKERHGGGGGWLLKWGQREVRGRGWWKGRLAELRREGILHLGERKWITAAAADNVLLVGGKVKGAHLDLGTEVE